MSDIMMHWRQCGTCSHVPCHNNYLIIRMKRRPIHLFVLPMRHPPSPSALRDPDLVDVVHRVGGRSRIAPWKLMAAAG